MNGKKINNKNSETSEVLTAKARTPQKRYENEECMLGARRFSYGKKKRQKPWLSPTFLFNITFKNINHD